MNRKDLGHPFHLLYVSVKGIRLQPRQVHVSRLKAGKRTESRQVAGGLMAPSRHIRQQRACKGQYKKGPVGAWKLGLIFTRV